MGLTLRSRVIISIIQFFVCFFGILLIQPVPELIPAAAAAGSSTLVTFILIPLVFKLSDDLEASRSGNPSGLFFKLCMVVAAMVIAVLAPVAYFFL